MYWLRGLDQFSLKLMLRGLDQSSLKLMLRGLDQFSLKLMFNVHHVCDAYFEFILRSVATSVQNPSSANEENATRMFRFTGLKNETAQDEIASYFIRFGQQADCKIEFARNGRRLQTFTVASSSPTVIAWLSSTSVHYVGVSICTQCKRKS